MSDLRPNLFDTDFDRLVQLGRSLLPKFAPAWTDHNLHDPGIMLIELLAWTAEAQIYSLARLRRDERWAYGALLGLYPRGPLPAEGLVWPDASVWNSPKEPPWHSAGNLLEAGEEIKASQPQTAAYRLKEPINLTAAKLEGVESRLHDGGFLNHKATNDRPGGAYFPFGEKAEADDRLVLTFQGPLLAPGNERGRKAYLSFGVRVPDKMDAAAEDMSCADSPARLVANLWDGLLSYPLPVKHDGTDGFLRTGAILLDLSRVPEKLSERFSIEFHSPGAGLAGPPRILGIMPNVLLVEQQERKPAQPSFPSNGLPGQTLTLEETGIRYGESFPPPRVFVSDACGEHEWKLVKDLTDCGPEGPEGRVFSFDHAARQIRFGNGVNGRIPPAKTGFRVEYETTEGDAGNLPAGIAWTVPGLEGTFGKNLDPVTGGMPELDLEELRREARKIAWQIKTIVTSSDLKKAALVLPDLRVARAEALPFEETGALRVALACTRTLVVLRERLPGNGQQAIQETPRWLEEARRQLAGRLPLGERLRVVAPDYQRLRISATLLSLSGHDPKEIQKEALDMLKKFFTLVEGPSGGALWPLGRPVEKLDISARLRKLEGVAQVKECELLWGDSSSPLDVPVFSNRFLPLLQTEQSQIDVQRLPTGSSP